jgi:hypothetical protein
MVSQQPVDRRLAPEEGQTPLVAHRHRQTPMHKALPEIDVMDHMPEKMAWTLRLRPGIKKLHSGAHHAASLGHKPGLQSKGLR